LPDDFLRLEPPRFDDEPRFFDDVLRFFDEELRFFDDVLRFDDDLRELDDLRLLEADFFFGTLPPARRASDNPIAIACLRLFTFLPERPLFSVPRLRSCIARFTLLRALLPYFEAMTHSSAERKVRGVKPDSAGPRKFQAPTERCARRSGNADIACEAAAMRLRRDAPSRACVAMPAMTVE